MPEYRLSPDTVVDIHGRTVAVSDRSATILLYPAEAEKLRDILIRHLTTPATYGDDLESA